jgi:hypothetical protein
MRPWFEKVKILRINYRDDLLSGEASFKKGIGYETARRENIVGMLNDFPGSLDVEVRHGRVGAVPS